MWCVEEEVRFRGDGEEEVEEEALGGVGFLEAEELLFVFFAGIYPVSSRARAWVWRRAMVGERRK